MELLCIGQMDGAEVMLSLSLSPRLRRLPLAPLPLCLLCDRGVRARSPKVGRSASGPALMSQSSRVKSRDAMASMTGSRICKETTCPLRGLHAASSQSVLQREWGAMGWVAIVRTCHVRAPSLLRRLPSITCSVFPTSTRVPSQRADCPCVLQTRPMRFLPARGRLGC